MSADPRSPRPKRTGDDPDPEIKRIDQDGTGDDHSLRHRRVDGSGPAPVWAGFAVAFISLSTVGQSLNKGALRMLGTLVAFVVSLTIIALFAQERGWFMVALSAWVGYCTLPPLSQAARRPGDGGGQHSLRN